MRKSLIVLCAALAAACGCSKSEKSKLVVGFSQIGAESAWRTAETKSIKDEAYKRGIELKSADAQGKMENQIQAIRDFISQGVDAIILAPQKEVGWEPVLREAKAAGIPVVLVDRGIKVPDEGLYTTLIAADFVKEGRRAAEWLAAELGEKGGIVQLLGTPGAAPAIDRRKGFEEVMAKYPNVKIVESQTGDFSKSKGKEVMESIIKALDAKGVAINAVYAHNDDMALGAILALDEAGLKPGKDVAVISIDGVRGAFEAMVDGKLNATVECNPLLGPLAFDAVEKALKGEKLEKWTVVPTRIFDKHNADIEIKNRTEY